MVSDLGMVAIIIAALLASSVVPLLVVHWRLVARWLIATIRMHADMLGARPPRQWRQIKE